MKTIKTSKTRQPRSIHSTRALNPKKQNPKKQNPTMNTHSLWDFFLQTREGTQTENLRRLGLKTLTHYANLGCSRAKLTLQKFSEFVSHCQLQIQGA